MPKVVSRSVVSASNDAAATASAAANLRVYYCICGEFILVIDTHLAVLPQRAADGATVVRAQDAPEGKARVFKLNAALDDPVLVERPGGRVERQFRHRCPRCQLQIAYQATPAAPPFLYILKGALTEIQGQVPADAFHGEIPP